MVFGRPVKQEEEPAVGTGWWGSISDDVSRCGVLTSVIGVWGKG